MEQPGPVPLDLLELQDQHSCSINRLRFGVHPNSSVDLDLLEDLRKPKQGYSAGKLLSDRRFRLLSLSVPSV